MVDFYQTFFLFREAGTKIAIESNFWLGVYV